MTEWIGKFFQSIGEVNEVFTLVDYYEYIKAVEYLICVAFFILFPMFYRYLNADNASKLDNH